MHEDDCRTVPDAARTVPLVQAVSGAAAKQRMLTTPNDGSGTVTEAFAFVIRRDGGGAPQRPAAR